MIISKRNKLRNFELQHQKVFSLINLNTQLVSTKELISSKNHKEFRLKARLKYNKCLVNLLVLVLNILVINVLIIQIQHLFVSCLKFHLKKLSKYDV